jgi:hypothetical protein
VSNLLGVLPVIAASLAKDAANFHRLANSPSSHMWQWRPKRYIGRKKIAIFPEEVSEE